MERANITDNLGLSRIVYGLWRIADDADTSVGHVTAKIQSCLEQGITTMDQADIYGNYEAESVFGDALRADPALRGQLEIVTKCGIAPRSDKFPNRRVNHYDTSAEHITASVEDSLRRMGTDYIDVLLIHRPDPFMDAAVTGAALDSLVASGKVRALGVSNFSYRNFSLLQSAMKERLVINQIELSPLHTTPFWDGSLDWMQEKGVTPMAWSPLAGGRLFGEDGARVRPVLDRIGAAQGVDATAVVVAWLLAHPSGILPVLGTNNLDRIAAMSDSTKVTMDHQTWFEIFEAANGYSVP